ncbi:hypothetical protein AB9F38_36825, partial [Rhizobium leguminosarum]
LWQQLSGRDLDPKREEFLLEHKFIERIGNSRLRCTPSDMPYCAAVMSMPPRCKSTRRMGVSRRDRRRRN